MSGAQGRTRRWLTVTLLVLVAAAAVARAVTLPPALGDAEIDALARDVGGRLQEAEALAQTRAATLAEIPRLGVLVYTDAETMHDLTQHELEFNALANESIEVRQFVRGLPPRVLLHIPATAAAIDAPDAPGVYVREYPTGAMVTEVRPVRVRTQSEESEKLGGAVVVSRHLDFGEARRTLQRAHSDAWLQVGRTTVPLVGDPKAAVSAPRRVPLGQLGENEATLLVARPAPLWLWLCLGVAGLAGLAALVVATRRSSVAAASSLATADTEASGRHGGGGVAIGPLSPTRSLGSHRSVKVLPAGNAPHTIESSDSGRLVESEDTELSLAEPDTNARRIGRYAIVRQLGTGGMADVYLARAQGPAGFEKQIALKVIKPALAHNTMIVEHLVAEARLATQLTHPNIVEVMDLGIGSSCFIAMELVDGADLQRLFDTARALGRPIPLPLALLILRAMCDGLHAAHQARGDEGEPLNIIHRDVKLANVLVGRNGVVKVSDFGIAYTDAVFRPFATEIGEIKGTAAYMAPEQRLGLSHDRRVDIYGVGVVAYQLLAGIRVNLDVVRLSRLGEASWPHLPPLGGVRNDLPPELEPIILRALAYRPEDRYESCDELEQALGEVAVCHGLVATRKQLARWVQELLATAPVEPRAADEPAVPAPQPAPEHLHKH